MKKILVIMLLVFSQTLFAEKASWYGKGFEGKPTASGYIYSSKQLTCASNKYPFGTVLKVTNKENKKSVLVVVTDTGSFGKKYHRDIDLSKAAFKKIGNINEGLLNVKIKVYNKKHVFKYKQGNPKFTNKEYKKYLK